MKILYLDCFAGASGDMLLGSLIDLGVSLDKLSAAFAGLNLTGYLIETEKVHKNGISGTRFFVRITDKHLSHRHLPDIKEIIDKATLPEQVKTLSLHVFENLAAAEAKIHGIPPEKVHFHEVGAIDSLIDIIGTVTAIDMLGVDKIVCSPLPLGCGFVECAHGILPLPAPAALELLSGVPTKKCDIDGETVTPTGAALIKTLTQQFGTIPDMKIEKVGYGAGAADRSIPNLLRSIVGESEEDICGLEFDTDFISIVEANIDDMNPEFYEYVVSLLFSNGALDVYLTSLIMKKGRPGQLLTCLAPYNKINNLVEIILTETSTLGVRTHSASRFKLFRETVTVITPYGPVKVKLGRRKKSGEILNAAPEWEDCKVLALKNNIPVKTVYDAAKIQFLNQTK